MAIPRIVGTAGKILFALLFLVGGVVHLARPEVYRPMMPPYIPAPDLMILLSGIAELVLGALLLWPRTQRLAAWGLIALLVAVFPANVHMYLHPELFPDLPQVGLLVRLPIQGLLIAWAWVYTRPVKPA
jgi:uncharacterized membrane protein